MKISTTRTLGSTLTNRGNAIRMTKASGERFSMTNEEVKQNGVEINVVSDLLGMLMSTQSLGDMIAETIANGMNACTLDFSKYFKDENGNIVRETLGENAVEAALIYAGLYWASWDKQSKTLNMDKAAKIVAERKGQKMVEIYTEDDINVISNKFYMERIVLGVNDYYIKRAEQALSSINEDTTLQELLNFQNGFVYITRGCGEQTIDVCKKVDNILCRVMKQLISPWAATIGRVREFSSNIKTYRRDKEKYEITIPTVMANGIVRKEDFIGRLKIAAAQTMENSMNEFISILDKETNYDEYKQYNEIDLSVKEHFEIAQLIDAVMDVLTTKDVKVADEDRERMLAAIYRKADELGLDRKMVIKIAIKLCISEIRYTDKGVYFLPVIGTKKEYLADIYKVAMMFGDVFTAEYVGTDELEIPVDYLAETNIDEGDYQIVDGYGCAGMLQVLGAYQNGTVRVRDGKLYALYNPVAELMKDHTNSVILTVDSYAKDNCKFNSWIPATTEDLDVNADEQTHSVGFNAVCNSKALRVICPKDSEQYVVAAIDNNNDMTPAAKLNGFTADSKDLIVVNTVAFKSLIVGSRIK